MFVIIDGITLIPSKEGRISFFLSSQSILVIYPNEENVFIMAHHEKKGFLRASMLVRTDEIILNLKNGGNKSFSYQAKTSIFFPNEDNVFIMPNNEKKRDSYMHPCLS